MNVHVYYNMVRGRRSQLLDSQFGLAKASMQLLNHAIKTSPTA